MAPSTKQRSAKTPKRPTSTRRPAAAAKKPASKPATKHVADGDTAMTAAVPVAQAPRRARVGLKLAITLMLMAVIGAAAGFGTYSAFSSTTANTGNAFQTGTVAIGDNDSNGSMFSLSNLKPGDASAACITVNYTGTLASSMKLYGTTTGSGLAQYLDLKVTRGSGAAGFNNCTGFTPDATNYIGAGNGVVYNGTVQSYPASYASALVDPTSGSPAVWNNGDSHQYQIQVTVQDNDLAQGLTANQSFTWEARNN
jgi:hypothetical protein